MKNTPFVLIILDGFGYSENKEGNPVLEAKMPYYKSLLKKYPHTLLNASGRYVGLPSGQDGNSEAGHLNIGAGRVVDSDSVKISKSIINGEFFNNQAFLSAIEHVKKNKSTLHLMGLLSSGQSAHSEADHFLGLITLLRLHHVKDINIHLFTDGRDAPPVSALTYLKDIMKFLLPNEKIVSIMGRFYAMDRKKQWIRTQKAYVLFTEGNGVVAHDPLSAISNAYLRGETDEYILPTAILNDNMEFEGTMNDHDAVIFFNLRSDRARQLAKPFVQNDFEPKGGFHRKKILSDFCFVAMADFGPSLDHIITAYPEEHVVGSISYALKDVRKLFISESEKFAHITYFLSGGVNELMPNEERIMIPSPNVSDYSLTPNMSVLEVSDVIIKGLKNSRYDFIATNFSSPDMIGHTGVYKSAILALENVDHCLKNVVDEVLMRGGAVIVTADHGNIEEMINLKTGEVDTKHSSNPVPFLLISEKHKNAILKKNMSLSSISPTILEIIGLPKTTGMNSESILSR